MNCMKFFYQNGCQGIFEDENLPNILSLMFADDIVNVADFVTHFQQQLNQLNYFWYEGKYVKD